MTWTTPAAVSVGELYAASKYNTQVKDNLLHLRARPGRLWLPASMWSKNPGASFPVLGFRGTSQNGIVAWQFDNANTGFIYLEINIPEEWVGVGPTAVLYWEQPASVAGNLRVDLYYSYISENGSLVGSGSAINFTLGPTNAADVSEVDTLGSLADPVTTTERVCRLSFVRDFGHGDDTNAQNLNFRALELFV